MKELLLIWLIVLTCGCSSEIIDPELNSTDFDTSGDPCKTDSDCWCRSFDGANFYNEKIPGYCDLNRTCRICYYE